MSDKVVIYQTTDGKAALEVHLEQETVWLRQKQMAELFGRNLLELREDRYGLKSTIITRQMPVTTGHEAIEDPTLADAILDRIVHNNPCRDR